MKKLLYLLIVLIVLFGMTACTGRAADKAVEKMMTTETTLSSEENEILQYLDETYGRRFRLWGPEGNDLYVFRIYEDHAERECHLLMGRESDDVDESHKNLSWTISGDKLVITGDWEERFQIDTEAETATSVETGKVYKIVKEK